MDINFSGTSFDTKLQYTLIRDLLLEELCIVEFTKLNGEIRQMPCTLKSDYAMSNVLPTMDMKEQQCSECNDGVYAETGIQDDMQGVLHCNNCNHEVIRHRILPVDYETLQVFCTDKQQWRSFKTMRVISVKVVPSKYTITLEEDPETQEVVLPFPTDLLAQMGWKEGDTLHWTDNENGSFSLSKTAPSSETT